MGRCSGQDDDEITLPPLTREDHADTVYRLSERAYRIHQEHQAAIEARDAAIEAADVAGYGNRTITRWAGGRVTTGTLVRILGRRTAQRQAGWA